MTIFMKRLFFSLVSISLIIGCNSKEPVEIPQDTIYDLFASIDSFETSFAHQDSLQRGFHLQGNFSSVSDSAYQYKLKVINQFLNRLNQLPEESFVDRLNNEVLKYRLENEKSLLTYKSYLVPISAEGGFYNEVNYALPTLPFKTKADYETYIKWLSNYPTFILQHKELLRQGMSEGIVASKIVAQNTLKLLQPWLSADKSPSPFMAPLNNMPNRISEQEQIELKQEVNELLATDIFPVYNNLYSFIANEYLPACTDQIGVSAITNGKEFYQNRLEHYTTLTISADSIFNLGLAEVARIKAKMEQVKTAAGFTGSLQDYIQYLRTDKQFYPETAEELLHYAAWLSKKSEQQLPKYFEQLYSLPFTVSPVPEEIAPFYTAGRYSPGSFEQQKAGEYWVNTFNLPARALYSLPALTLHEAVPGHHLHHALTSELTDVPPFRSQFYISAFGEGWALYCEYLGEEMGMYTTPAEWFGRYTYEMWRACRLVVDVGIHAKGWTRERAIDYLKENTALSVHEVTTEIDRYIGWPGQALSYKIGELKIKELRKHAEETLGNKFDIRQFHNLLLSQGSLPLPLLEEMVEDWIKKSS